MFTVGVEEEYHLVDQDTMALCAADAVVDDARARLAADGGKAGRAAVAAEISSSQVEVATEVCSTLAEVREQLLRLRKVAASAADGHGCRILAMATHPFSSWRDQRLTDNLRYVRLFERWGVLALQQLITGCHVHTLEWTTPIWPSGFSTACGRGFPHCWPSPPARRSGRGATPGTRATGRSGSTGGL